MRAPSTIALLFAAAGMACTSYTANATGEDSGADTSESDTSTASDSGADTSSANDTKVSTDTATTDTNVATDSATGDTAACSVDAGSCSTYPLCGCGVGMNCVPVGGKLSCIAQGLGGKNEKCTDDRGCAAGFACESGLCRPYCSPSVAASCSDGQCIDSGSHVFCWQACDPLNSNSCGPGGGCSPHGDATTGIGFYCDVAGTLVGPAACSTSAGVCAAGYACGGASPNWSCLQFCNATTSTGCPAGKTCTAQTTPANWTHNGTKIGLCQ